MYKYTTVTQENIKLPEWVHRKNQTKGEKTYTFLSTLLIAEEYLNYYKIWEKEAHIP